jgi:hypothetical protein
LRKSVAAERIEVGPAFPSLGLAGFPAPKTALEEKSRPTKTKLVKKLSTCRLVVDRYLFIETLT